jgi:hypothetical protein
MKLLLVCATLSIGSALASGAQIVSYTTSSGSYTASGANLYPGLVPLVFTLDDGTNWSAGAGSAASSFLTLSAVNISSGVINYALLPTGDPFVQFSNFGSGSNGASGVFGVITPLTLVATVGSPDATLSGFLVLESNTPTGANFNYFGAPVGALVPFAESFHLASGGWSSTTFDSSFTYSASASERSSASQSFA